MNFNIIKIVYLFLAFFFLALGIVGIALPVLPTTPFLLLASYFFAKGSDRFNRWFMSTDIYKNHLEEFVETKAMTLKKKLCILIPVSIILLITFFNIKNTHGKIAIILAIIFKYYYFFRYIKTIDKEKVKSN